jgi:serine/threonine protein kinase
MAKILKPSENPAVHNSLMRTVTPSNKKSVNKYEVYGTLGKGGFAIVMAVRDSKGREYALKKPFHKQEYLSKSTGVINMKELFIMACVRHPYIQRSDIVFFEDPCPNDNIMIDGTLGFDRLFFLMSKADYTCHELVHRHRAPIHHIKRAMFQAALAIHHLHTLSICHRDVKPGNFLCYWDKTVLTVKVTDFGMTKPMNFVNNHSLHAGTAYYRSPELLLQNRRYGFSMDIWALGCSFFEMVSRIILFKGNSDLDLLKQIFAKRGSPSPQVYAKMAAPGINIALPNSAPQKIRTLLNLGPNDVLLFDSPMVGGQYSPGSLEDFCDLVDGMLQLDPDARLNMDQVLRHRFFAGYWVENPNDFNLWRPSIQELDANYRRDQMLDVVQIYPEDHPHWLVGANIFIYLANHNPNYDYELLYTLRFHGLDVYSRFLLKIEPVDDPLVYKKIAWCSGYIVSKFFLDEASDHVWDIFEDSIDDLSVGDINKYERLILQVLEFEVYRPTCFTFLEHRAFYATLFALMLRGKMMFNRPIRNIMQIVNREIERIIASNPHSIIPLE